jgi:predicted transcriptional regulator
MKDSGNVYFENPWKIKWAEEKLRRLEEAVGPLIMAVASGEADTDEFQESLDEFGGKLLVIKEELHKIERALDQAGDYRPGK